MAAGRHGNTGSSCWGNRLFNYMSDEIHGNTSQQLSPSMACERGLSGRMQHWINKSVFIACEQVKGLYGASHSAVRAVEMDRRCILSTTESLDSLFLLVSPE